MEIKLKKTQVAEMLREEIRSGKFPVGSKIPRGTELAGRYGVSHITIRAALEELAKEGLLSLIHGRGTFVIGNGHLHATRKILVIRSVVSLQNVSGYILPDFEKRCCELRVLTESAEADFLLNAPRKQLLGTIRNSGFTGIMIPGGGFMENDPLAEIFRSSEIPILIAHGNKNDSGRTGLPVLRTDYAGAWDDGAKFLHSIGCRKIAVLSNSTYRTPYYSKPEFQHRLEEFGLRSDPELIASSDESEEQFIAVLNQLLSAAPEAIFCGSDFFAMRTCEYLALKKIRVPEDISVLGFSGYPGGQFFSPPLTTVDFQYSKIGRLAADLLYSPSEWFDPDNPIDHFTPHRMLIRASTAQ